MGLFGKFFGNKKSQPYVHAGRTLTLKLTRSLNLPGWNEGLPNYTHEEVAAIDHGLSQFQYMANRELGGEAKFHPDVVPEIRRKLVGDALAELARHKLMDQSEDIPTDAENIPTDWKPIASAFLKAWASLLDPLILMELGDLLAKVGHRNEARETFHVVLLFPTYAKTLWGKSSDDLLEWIVGRAKEALQTLNLGVHTP